MNPTPIRAVAFDLDGLMFDTEALSCRVLGEMLATRGKVFTPEIMGSMLGRQANVAYPALKALAQLDESIEELQAETRERFAALIDTAVHPTPGLIALLNHLDHKNVPRSVCTSSRRAYAEKLIERHGISRFFSFLLCAEDVINSKPDPEIYLLAATKFGIEPANLLVLEDSPAGLTAAKAAGAFAVGIPHEHSPVEKLGHADWIVPRLDDPGVAGADCLKQTACCPRPMFYAGSCSIRFAGGDQGWAFGSSTTSPSALAAVFNSVSEEMKIIGRPRLRHSLWTSIAAASWTAS